MLDELDELQADYKKNPTPELRKEIRRQLKQRSEAVFDLDNLPKIEHKFIDRGEKFTCEAGTHPYHEVWKRR